MLQKPKGKPVLTNHQFRGRQQYLERFSYRCSMLGCCSRPYLTLDEASGHKEHQHDHTAD
jgi:hypothetical protein